MRNRYAILLAVFLICCASCSTSKLSRKEINKLAAGMTYATVPASVLGTSADVKVHYVEAGRPSAPPMILIHGFASAWFTWKKIMPELAKNYHVFAIDLPGFGFSDKPKDFPYGLDGYGKTVMNFMDQKNIQKAILVGNSMGGGVSVWMANHHPERARRLILIDAFSYPSKAPGLVSIASKSWLRPLAKPLFGKWMLRMGLKQVYYDKSKVTPQLVEEYGRPFKTPRAKDVPFWLLKNLDRKETSEEVKRLLTIKIPTLIIWGENDTWIPLENAFKFKSDIKGSELVVIPNCGHTPQEEKPQETLKAIMEFLQKSP